MFKYRPTPKPHFTVLHDMFNEPETASYADVMAAYGSKLIRDRIASAMQDGILTAHSRIKGPMNKQDARLAVWRHLRRVIEEQRERNRRRAKRMADYTGDMESPSPLNPFRIAAPVDFEDSFGLNGSDRDLNPMVL